MNLRETIGNFSRIREDILKDGRIDPDEADAVLRFIEPYCRTYSYTFFRLNEMMWTVKRGKVLSDKEFEEVSKMMHKAESFLRTELKVERFMGYFAAFVILSALFALLLP